MVEGKHSLVNVMRPLISSSSKGVPKVLEQSPKQIFLDFILPAHCPLLLVRWSPRLDSHAHILGAPTCWYGSKLRSARLHYEETSGF
jgi:hypothetical protein